MVYTAQQFNYTKTLENLIKMLFVRFSGATDHGVIAEAARLLKQLVICSAEPANLLNVIEKIDIHTINDAAIVSMAGILRQEIVAVCDTASHAGAASLRSQNPSPDSGLGRDRSGSTRSLPTQPMSTRLVFGL